MLERLRSESMPPFAMIEGAARLAAVQQQDSLLALPAAFVFALTDTSEPNERVSNVLQRNTATVGVVIVAGDVSDAIGGAASADVEVLKAEVRRRLIGWQPPSAEDVVTHEGGSLVDMRAGNVWWEDRFRTARYLEDEEA